VSCIIALVPNLKPLADKANRPSTGFALFGEGRASKTAVMWLCFLTALITQYILLSWLPSLLGSKGLAKPDASLAQMTYNLGSVPGAIIAGMLIDNAARRSASIIGVFGSGILALVILAAAPAQMPLSLMVAALVGLTVSGSQAIMYALAPGVYPTYVRGTGVGFALAIGRIGSATGPLLAGADLTAAGAGSACNAPGPRRFAADLSWPTQEHSRAANITPTDAPPSRPSDRADVPRGSSRRVG